jgi:acetolactate synthase small subunit
MASNPAVYTYTVPHLQVLLLDSKMTLAYILSAVIIGGFSIAAAFIGLMNRVKINEIHIMVNSRLDQAIEQIHDLISQRDRQQRKEDEK